MSRVNDQKALETVINYFYGNCTVEKAQEIIDELLDMGLATTKYCLNGRKIILLEGWSNLYDSYKAQSRE